jgi:hypothetical protein
LGFLFESVNPVAFPHTDADAPLLLALLNSEFANYTSKILNPSLHFKPGNAGQVPIPDKAKITGRLKEVCEECVSISRSDWDSFETSWDFRGQPLLRPGLREQKLERSWQKWEVECGHAICRMQELETENNRLFIAAYGLDGELQPEVPEDQITLARADQCKDVAAFLSYATGCMMGRYSLDHPGLILANAGDTLDNY